MCITHYETRVIHRAGGAASTMAWRMQHPAGRHRPSDARLRAGTASRRCRFATGRRYAGQTSVAQVPSRPANPPLRTTRDAHWVGRLPRRRGFLRQRTGPPAPGRRRSARNDAVSRTMHHALRTAGEGQWLARTMYRVSTFVTVAGSTGTTFGDWVIRNPPPWMVRRGGRQARCAAARMASGMATDQSDSTLVRPLATTMRVS
jgi:hypothetical protein